VSQVFSKEKYPCIRYFIGDVRDQERLHEAFYDAEYVIHAAALKQVPAAEYNPFEAIKTNVLGAQNVIRAAISRKVKKVIALSTDKAANPVNLYDTTKLCSDKLFIAGNAMSGDTATKFSIVRYGNAVASRGSVIPFLQKIGADGVIPITDERMTRFSITLAQGVDFVIRSFDRMLGGEVFVTKIPSYRILDVAKAVAPNARISVVGIRPGEKLHETMVPADESHLTREFENYFVIRPSMTPWTSGDPWIEQGGKPCPEGFRYSSERNTKWLTVDDIRSLAAEQQGLL
jgi:UDP-N-acetylglucosamine 4,6-dehydratase